MEGRLLDRAQERIGPVCGIAGETTHIVDSPAPELGVLAASRMQAEVGRGALELA